VVGHIGDSRAYRLRGGELTQLTEDHSLLQEQINSGLITPEQAKTSNNKNLVTRALGIDLEVELELREYDVKVGDLYMLCSDGLNDMIEDEEIQRILIDAHGNIELAANLLIQAANNNGGKDNISVVIALVKKEFAADKGWVKSLLGKVKN
jgi:protein phosphatase